MDFAKEARDAAWLAIQAMDEMRLAGGKVTMRMRMLANYNYQLELLGNTHRYGPDLANTLFDMAVKKAEAEDLYNTFCDMMRNAQCTEENIIPLRAFMLHTNRGMEYAQRCLDIVNDPQVFEHFKAMGRSFGPEDYDEFDIQRCREISQGMS
jgi:hypothetical protein